VVPKLGDFGFATEYGKLNGLDPQTYLCDVLERIVSGRTKNHQLHELLAWNWKAAREAAGQIAA
jgi:transposase